MVAVTLELLFRVSALHPHRNPNSKSRDCKRRTAPHSIPLSAPTTNPPTIKTLKRQSNARPVTPFCLLLLPLLHSVGGLVVSRARKMRSCLRGGLDDGEHGIHGQDLVCSGGIGTLLMSTTAASKARVSPFLWALAANPTFVSGVVGWALAQTMKVLLNFFVERRWDLGMLFTSGGMPSSHSALCTALTTSVALCHGVGDSLFPVCLGFSLIVMYDAIGVRRHAGMHAEVLNKIVADLFQGHPISQRKLKELLGHTPSQVIAGALLGILVSCFCCQGCVVAI